MPLYETIFLLLQKKRQQIIFLQMLLTIRTEIDSTDFKKEDLGSEVKQKTKKNWKTIHFI